MEPTELPEELASGVPIELASVEATRALGARLASVLRAGDVVVLAGPLGAGKTALTQGLGTGLGVRSPITSPTYVLARVHEGSPPLVHVDAYRLREAGARLELDDLDLDLAVQEAVTVVEWGSGLAEQLADSWLEVTLDRPADGPPERRTAVVRAYGPRWGARPH